MATMIPGLKVKDLQKDFNGSAGEFRLYELLEKLPDEYYIFHSTSWNEQRRRDTIPTKK